MDAQKLAVSVPEKISQPTTKPLSINTSFYNFTIANGELKSLNTTPAIIKLRENISESLPSSSSNSLAKPIIVTVAGVPSIKCTNKSLPTKLPVGFSKIEIEPNTYSRVKSSSAKVSLPPTLTINSSGTVFSLLPLAEDNTTAVSANQEPLSPSVGNHSLPPVLMPETSCYESKAKDDVPVDSSIKNNLIVNNESALSKSPDVLVSENAQSCSVPEPSNKDSEDCPVIPMEEGSADVLNNDPNSIDFDPIKAMDWKDGIGTLPGSNLRFKLDEFGSLEMIVEESDEVDSSNIVNSPPKEVPKKRKIGRPPKEEAKVEPKSGPPTKIDDEIRCCENCGTYGLGEEFYENSTFCCRECFIVNKKKIDKRRRKKELQEKRKQNLMFSENRSGSQESSDESTRAIEYEAAPKTFVSNIKGFHWASYLDSKNATAAPVKLFNSQQSFPASKNNFRVGMKLEGIDPKHPSLFCVMTVVEVVGYRLRLHFDGYSDCYDFWANANSLDIFPVGWCERTGHKLEPPKGHTSKGFNWDNYLRASKAVAAYKTCFAINDVQNETSHGFKLNMKLEAVDKKNSSLVCVATVKDVIHNRFLIHFDGWDAMYNYWVDPSSPYIHPVNWCKNMGHVLTPPNNYKDPNHFDWDEYLLETKSIAAPNKLFKQRSQTAFKKGMRLEVVDKRNPILIRVAHVADVLNHSIRISFDGWSDSYDYWVDDDSPDIHPVSWCFSAGYPIVPPPAPKESSADQGGCPTLGCTGIGHIKGPKYISHHSAFGCPYSNLNINKDSSLGDRLGNLRSGEAVYIEPLLKKSEAANSQTSSKSLNDEHQRFRRCPTPGCKGNGHVTGKYTVHHRVSGCPLAVTQKFGQSIKTEGSKPLNSQKTDAEDTPPIVRSKQGRKKKKSIKLIDQDLDNMDLSVSSSDSASATEKTSRTNKGPKSSLQEDIHRSVFTSTSIFHPSLTEDLPLGWEKHTMLLPGLNQMTALNVIKWSFTDVASFVASLTGNIEIGKVFKDEQIDGEAFMLLTQLDIVKMLSIKLGPALKIYNCILSLKKSKKY